MAGANDQQALINSLGSLPIAMVLSNPRRADNPIEVANPAFCGLTGYAEGEILGRNCRFLTGNGTEKGASLELSSAIRSGRPILVDILNYRSDGRPFRNGVMITPLFGSDGEIEWFLGSQVELPMDSTGLGTRRSDAAASIADLPQRQREVLQGMAHGLLNKQIAWRLKISEKTVKMHRALLIERLGVKTSAEAIRIAVEGGL